MKVHIPIPLSSAFQLNWDFGSILNHFGKELPFFKIQQDICHFKVSDIAIKSNLKLTFSIKNSSLVNIKIVLLKSIDFCQFLQGYEIECVKINANLIHAGMSSFVPVWIRKQNDRVRYELKFLAFKMNHIEILRRRVYMY